MVSTVSRPAVSVELPAFLAETPTVESTVPVETGVGECSPETVGVQLTAPAATGVGKSTVPAATDVVKSTASAATASCLSARGRSVLRSGLWMDPLES